MNVRELIGILANVPYSTPVEIEIDGADGDVRRSVEIRAAKWKRGKTGDELVLMIEGPELGRRAVRDVPQA